MFGPVITVHEWEDEDTAVKEINASEFGLAASVFTTDLKRAHRLAQRIDAGTVSVNGWEENLHGVRPFGGVKQSGNGREGGKYAHDFYTDCKNVVIKL